jgi:hypothetical protein
MPLSPAQLQTLKQDIAANTNLINGVAINTLPQNGDTNFDIANWYNGIASPDFYVYRNNIPVQEVYDKITWSNLTPSDVADGTQTWANRSLACQGKQFNLQIILQGQNQIDATKSNIRAGLQDCLTNIPSGAGGATVAAGWVTVRDSLYTPAKNAEKLFATGTGTTGSPATRVVYGNISAQDVDSARNLP